MKNPLRPIAATMLRLLLAMPSTADDLDLHPLSLLGDKERNPNELAYSVWVRDECPVTEKEATDIIESVFNRSRIKPTNNWGTDNLYLSVKLDFIGPGVEFADGRYFVYSLHIYFGDFSVLPPILYNHPYIALGYGPIKHIVGTLKDRTEAAITDYIKVNVGLDN